MLSVLLIGCGTVPFDAQPDLVVYAKEVQEKAVLEMENGSCPVLSNTFMPNYLVMRDHAGEVNLNIALLFQFIALFKSVYKGILGSLECINLFNASRSKDVTPVKSI